MASKVEQWLKCAYESYRIRATYGERYPAVVRPPVGTIGLHIDPYDRRARKMITAAAVRGKTKVNQRFWAGAIRRFRPTVAVDVGVNFGECLLAHEYPSDIVLHGVEANPRILGFLERTLREHPNSSQIHLHGCAAGDVASPAIDFFIDREWSGCSAVSVQEVGRNIAKYDKVSVPADSVDNLVQDLQSSDRLLFKIDVEGSEPAVVRGMRETLAKPENLVGLVEFDIEYMTHQRVDLVRYWSDLAEVGDIYRVGGRQVIGPLPRTWNAAAKGFAACSHGDIIITRGDLAQDDLQRICFPDSAVASRAA